MKPPRKLQRLVSNRTGVSMADGRRSDCFETVGPGLRLYYHTRDESNRDDYKQMEIETG
jgi:hypothetical protein